MYKPVQVASSKHALCGQTYITNDYCFIVHVQRMFFCLIICKLITFFNLIQFYLIIDKLFTFLIHCIYMYRCFFHISAFFSYIVLKSCHASYSHCSNLWFPVPYVISNVSSYQSLKPATYLCNITFFCKFSTKHCWHDITPSSQHTLVGIHLLFWNIQCMTLLFQQLVGMKKHKLNDL